MNKQNRIGFNQNMSHIKIALMMMSLLFIASCTQPNTSTTTTNGAGSSTSSGGTKRVAFVTNNAADFWSIARKGTEKADAELNDLTVEFKIPSDGTAAEQKRIIDDLLAKGVSGIAISPVDPNNQVQLINDTAKQTLVVTQDSDAPTSDRACYIGTDNVAAGRQAGELIKEVLPQGGKFIVFVGNLDARNAQERLQGIKEAIAGTNIQMVDTRTDNADQVRAKSNTADALVRYPDVNLLVGLYGYNGPAILSAVRDANKINQVKIVCFDEQDETLAGVKEGAIYATVVQQPFEFGYQAVKLMHQILNGDRSAIPQAKQILVPTLVIKREAVDDFQRKINEMRGR